VYLSVSALAAFAFARASCSANMSGWIAVTARLVVGLS
jgi:hypothetical protein